MGPNNPDINTGSGQGHGRGGAHKAIPEEKWRSIAEEVALKDDGRKGWSHRPIVEALALENGVHPNTIRNICRRFPELFGTAA